MALTREQAKKAYEDAIAAGFSDEEAKAAISKRISSEGKATKVRQMFSNENPLGMAANALQQSGPGQFVTGMAEQLGETARGARQLFNYATGDAEELEQLKSQESQIQQDAQALRTGGLGSQLLRGAGRGAGMLLPGMLTGGAASAQAALGGTAARIGAGTLGGALGGASQPLTEGQGDMENRLPGAIMGATIGGGGTAALAGGGKLLQMLRRQSPDEALQDFTARQLGATRGGENLPAYKRIGEAVSSTEKKLRESFSQRYDAVESSKGLPKVRLGESAAEVGEMPVTLSDEVVTAFSPKARKLIQAISKGTDPSSSILDAAGHPIQRAETTTFADVRDTIRQLREVGRILGRTEGNVGQARMLGRVEDALSRDLDKWSKQHGDAVGDTLSQARRIDKEYGEQVVPFSSQKTELGRFGKSGQYSEKDVDRLFLQNQQGQAVEDLMQRVPGVRDDVRQLYGAKLLESRGNVGTIKQVEGGTAGEVILKPKEREYLAQIGDALRDDNMPGDLALSLIRGLRKLPGARKALKTMTGMDPYSEAQKGVYSTQYLVDALRSALVGQGATQLMGGE